MAIQSGVYKQIRSKVETTYGVPPGASGGQVLRRVTSDISLEKDTYESSEIRTDFQVADMRHGMRRVRGTVRGEISNGTYTDFFAAIVRRDFTAGVAATGLSITVAGAGPYTLTRSAGSWITDGFRVGDVIRATAGSFNAANINKNLMIVALTATVATVISINGVALVAEGPIASASVSVTGKRTFVGSADRSLAIEHWFPTIAQSELYTGCKVDTVALSLPPTGMATVDFGVIGKDVVTGTSAYYTSPTAMTSTGVTAAVNGALVAGGVQIATCTGATINISGGYSPAEVAFSNSAADVFPGRVRVTGSISVYFENATFRDAFINETEATLSLALTAGNGAADHVFAVTLPRIKYSGASKDDGEKGIIQTMPFTALLASATGLEASTIVIQDTAA